MQNSSYAQPSVMFLGFGEMKSSRYVYSVIAFLAYALIIVFNSSIISVIVLHKSLQEPMYLFLAVLCINGLYGSTAFFPILVFDLFNNIKTISYIGCIIQVYCIHTYLTSEMTILTAMAYDRYVCICNPLRYNNIMSFTTVTKLVCLAWLYSIFVITVHIMLTIRLPLCSNVILKVYCDNWSIVRLSCVDISVNNGFGLFIAMTAIALMPALIICSYILILRACIRSSKDFRAKALQTCTPHMITMTNYACNLLFELLMYRFIPTEFPFELRMVMSIQPLVVPPILNPLIYGLKLKEIRGKILNLYRLRDSTVHNSHF